MPSNEPLLQLQTQFLGTGADRVPSSILADLYGRQWDSVYDEDVAELIKAIYEKWEVQFYHGRTFGSFYDHFVNTFNLSDTEAVYLINKYYY